MSHDSDENDASQGLKADLVARLSEAIAADAQAPAANSADNIEVRSDAPAAMQQNNDPPQTASTSSQMQPIDPPASTAPDPSPSEAILPPPIEPPPPSSTSHATLSTNSAPVPSQSQHQPKPKPPPAPAPSVTIDPELMPSDEDLLYEEELLRNPYNLKMWTRYLMAKVEAPPKRRYLLYERALRSLPGSYKVRLRERGRER